MQYTKRCRNYEIYDKEMKMKHFYFFMLQIYTIPIHTSSDSVSW